MSPFWMRALGFALPTNAIVTAGHHARAATPGEALAGVVSGLFFTAFFAGGAWLGARRAGPASGEETSLRAVATGLIAGVLVWGALWTFWSRVPHEGAGFPTNAVFAAHSALMAATGWVAAIRRGSGPRQITGDVRGG